MKFKSLKSFKNCGSQTYFSPEKIEFSGPEWIQNRKKQNGEITKPRLLQNRKKKGERYKTVNLTKQRILQNSESYKTAKNDIFFTVISNKKKFGKNVCH